jgi:hypothetical protein
MIMSTTRVIFQTLALAATIGWTAYCPAQERGKPKEKDEALDSLIEKLSAPDQAGTPASKPRQPDAAGQPARPEAPKGRDNGVGAKAGKRETPAKPGSGDVSSQDKELDELLEKLGETKDEPAPRDRSRARPQSGEPAEPSGPAPAGGEKPKDKAKAPDLQGKDKEIDERLEEFTGRKRKKSRPEQEEGSGPLGQIIKEMRDVEQKLGKPETGEDTQSKQKQIVKKLETLIEQMKQSGASGSMALRMIRQQGQMPGDKSGQTPGANAGGAPPMKPAKPSERHALAGGKDIWGHLPDELRQEMDNVFKEEALPTKQDTIRRYYLSVSKKKLVRGE